MEYLQFVADNIFTFTFGGTFGILGGILVAVIAIPVAAYLLVLLLGLCMIVLGGLACLLVKVYSVLKNVFCHA